MNSLSRNDLTAAHALAAKIAALPDTADAAIYAPLVLAIFAGATRSQFEAVDNAIGSASDRFDFGGRGHLVRRVRNDPTTGRALFAALSR